MPNLKTFDLETLYTPYTLDTYGTFSLDSEVDYLLENFNDPKPDPEITYDDLEWVYDIDGYLKALATNLLELLQKNILDEVITAINSDIKISRPREYNFTTDCTWLDFTVDMDKLQKFIADNQADYNENCIKSRDGFMWFGEEHHTMLAYYLAKVSAETYTPDDYFMDQMDRVYAGDYVEATLKPKSAI